MLLTAMDAGRFYIQHAHPTGNTDPRPLLTLATCIMQYGKAGRVWYMISCEHHVINKWQKFSEWKGNICLLLNQLHVQCMISVSITSCKLDTCGKLTFALHAVLTPVHLHTTKPLFHPYVTHVTSCTRLSHFSKQQVTKGLAGTQEQGQQAGTFHYTFWRR